ncbi:MAG: hypothetical protein WC740_11625 [Verrucomicrobiia bacterium]
MTIDTTVLLQLLKRNKKHFEAMIFWRDAREVGTALLMVPIILWIGVRDHLPWTFFLMIPAVLWIAGFMLTDRILQKRRQPQLDNPLRDCLERLLAQVEHQIGLLRNVFWWYLLPVAAAMAAFLGHVTWHIWAGGWHVRLASAVIIAVITLIFWGVYWLNQRAVRRELEPRREELRALISNLENDNPEVLSSGEMSSSKD